MAYYVSQCFAICYTLLSMEIHVHIISISLIYSRKDMYDIKMYSYIIYKHVLMRTPLIYHLYVIFSIYTILIYLFGVHMFSKPDCGYGSFCSANLILTWPVSYPFPPSQAGAIPCHDEVSFRVDAHFVLRFNLWWRFNFRYVLLFP